MTTLCMASCSINSVRAHPRRLIGVVVALAAAAFAYYKLTQVGVCMVCRLCADLLAGQLREALFCTPSDLTQNEKPPNTRIFRAALNRYSQG